MAEKGTHNSSVVIGTGRAVEIIEEIGIDVIADYTNRLASILREGVAEIDGVNILTPLEPGKSTGITTLTFDGYAPEDLQGLVGRIYSEHNTVVKFQWLTAPMSLDKIGMRISTGAINSEEEVRGLIAAIKDGTSQ